MLLPKKLDLYGLWANSTTVRSHRTVDMDLQICQIKGAVVITRTGIPAYPGIIDIIWISIKKDPGGGAFLTRRYSNIKMVF